MNPRLLFLLLLVCPLGAAAANFSYDYLQLDYFHLTPQNLPASKGPGVDLSYSVLNEFQLLGSYARLRQPAVAGGNVLADDYAIGIRSESAFGGATDFYTDILYLNHHSSYQGASSTDSGYRLLLGVRHRAAARVELEASLAHDYLNQSSNELTVGVRFAAVRWLALGASYTHDSQQNNTAALQLRFYF